MRPSSRFYRGLVIALPVGLFAWFHILSYGYSAISKLLETVAP